MQRGLLDREWREKLPPICVGCGYNLTGVASERCPECGRAILWTELKQNAKDVYYSLQRVEDVHDFLNIGVWLGGAGTAMLLLMWLVGWEAVGSLAGVFLGIATLGSGMQVFRVRRFPEWAREFVKVKPNYMGGVALVLWGLATITAAVALL